MPRMAFRAHRMVETGKGDNVKGKGLRQERETTITFNEVEGDASIWTASEPMCRKLKRLGFYPEEDRGRSATFKIPKKCVSFRRVVVISEEQKEKQRQRGQALRREYPTLPVLPR